MAGKTIEILFGKKGDFGKKGNMTHEDTAKIAKIMKQIESEKKIKPADYEYYLSPFQNLKGDEGRAKTCRLKVTNYPGTAEELLGYFNIMVAEGCKIIEYKESEK